ncbi:cation transporting ATPase [Myxozyma melibiosi]|uniref:Cation transporting ATPase n=1 Tax=Myxozyma melibiosi TaxID=54550 RepID=A0ABR1F1F3_9ASCO
MPSALVPNPGVEDASLHDPLPFVLRTYIWPFFFLYPAFGYFYFLRYEEYINGSEWTFVYLGTIISFQALLWLMTHWSVNVLTLFTTVKATDPKKAKLIRVIPIANAGQSMVCKLSHIKSRGHEEISFLFQKRRFIFDPETSSFSPPIYPIDLPRKIGEFQTTTGNNDIANLTLEYGDNRFDIPVPTFLELFYEHAVAPFFVFQVFCVALWLLDELWYYSLFTLFMLVAFESTVVFQRQRTMIEFRGMGIQPYDIYVYRNGEWTEITTDHLLPGDVVSVVRTKDDSGLPCDLLLVNGSAIVNEAMLSGESTPLLKESILLRPADEILDLKGLDKNSELYGGTKVLQITPPTDCHIPLPPDGGAIAVATRTGFETSQGSLVRTMIFSTERVGAGNAEALFFILFLLIFAIAASWYVWTEGVKIDRKRSKLLLDCIIIITSVVPPELPMELSMAVNSSLGALGKFAIYCTEPFRIPFAGRVDVCCFDKTGTLTGEDLVLEGIAGLLSSPTDLLDVKQVAHNTTLVLTTAHALVRLDEGEVVGEPMEKATLKALGWSIGKNDTLQSNNKTGGQTKVRILRRFQFSSALKRSSSIATSSNKYFISAKGAPETVRGMLREIPEKYEETYKYFTRRGSRVLALGIRFLPDDLSTAKTNNFTREEVERDLTFAGFLVFNCPLKPDAIEAVKMLNESSHRVVMITGDNPLTAVHVAYEVEIVTRDVLILDAPEEGTDGGEHALVFRNVEETYVEAVDPTKPIDAAVFAKYDICVTGYALAKFTDYEHVWDLIKHTWVWARVSPSQKEYILIQLKNGGYTTLMCGDGTNDVGALKQAHIGVALLNGTEESLKKIAENAKFNRMKDVYQKQCDMMVRWGGKVPPVPPAIAHLYPPGPNNPNYRKAIEARGGTVDEALVKAAYTSARADPNVIPHALEASQTASSLADKMMSMVDEEDDTEAPTLKLGDASVAAPFTSKLGSVNTIVHIIRQGRCTLVATIQMYKILALNCLISAYSLSVLYLAGIKFGDGQATISGMLMSVCFYSISRGKAVDKLSKERPQPGIFNFYIMGSILGQFAIHIVTLIYVTKHAYLIEPREDDIDLEAEFKPSLLNSAIYLLQLSQQVSTVAVNYQGRPFRENISENRAMYYGLAAAGALAFAGASEFIPELNEKLRLVPFEYDFKVRLCVAMSLDYAGAWVIEVVLKKLFSDYKPKDIAIHEERDPEDLVVKKTQ